MAEHDFHEFVGAIVARIVTDHFVTAHILRFTIVERRDDVPGSTAAGHQIEGCEYPGDVKRLVVACRIGRAQAEPFGRHAHHGEHSDGIKFHAANAVLDGMRVIASIHVRHGQAIIEKAEMEFAGFQHAANVTVEIRRPAVTARLRMAPGARQIGAVLRLQKTDQNHLAHFDSHLSLRGAKRRSNPAFRSHKYWIALRSLSWGRPFRAGPVGSRRINGCPTVGCSNDIRGSPPANRSGPYACGCGSIGPVSGRGRLRPAPAVGTVDARGVDGGSITDSRFGRLPKSRSLISSPVSVSNSSRPFASVSRSARLAVSMVRASS